MLMEDPLKTKSQNLKNKELGKEFIKKWKEKRMKKENKGDNTSFRQGRIQDRRHEIEQILYYVDRK